MVAVQSSSSARVAVLVFPFPSPNTCTLTHKLITMVSSAAAYTVLLAGEMPSDFVWPDRVRVVDIGVRFHRLGEKQPAWFSAILWIAKMMLVQARFALEVLRLRGKIDVVFCTLGLYYQLPILVARLLNKKVICSSFGHDAERVRINYGSRVVPVAKALRRFQYLIFQSLTTASIISCLPGILPEWITD